MNLAPALDVPIKSLVVPPGFWTTATYHLP